MKISNKEKIMLFILGIILIGYGYYNFVYTVQINKIQEKMQQESTVKEKYETTRKTINSMDDKKSDVKILKAKISDESIPFYPIISEEHIIVELDELLKNSDLEGGITFEPTVSDSVENSKNEKVSLAESSLQGVAEKYNSTLVDEETVEKPIDKVVDDSKKNVNGSKKSDSKNSKEIKKNTIQYLKCEVKFEGTYEGIDKFLNEIDKNEKKIVVNSIKISEDTLFEIKGTINLEIYSIPKITDELESYLKWDYKNTYGKSVPFSRGAASEIMDESKETSDFVASVKSVNSESPTIMLGKTNDELRTTYVYADNNSKENVEITLSQDGDKYYYKYKTSKGKFPINYDGPGAEFIPISKNIVLDILSESRINDSDSSELKLKIINSTDKLAEVNIKGDDSVSPRVVIDGDGNKISVNKK